MKFKGSLGKFLKNSMPNKLGNLEEMEKFPDTYDLPKLNQKDIKYLNISMTNIKMEAVVKSFLIKD